MMRTWGDAFGYYLVAAGQTGAMIDPVCSPWDLAPACDFGRSGRPIYRPRRKEFFRLECNPRFNQWHSLKWANP